MHCLTFNYNAFFKLAFLWTSYACYTSIDDLDYCDTVEKFTYSGEKDFYCYLATEDFTTDKEGILIELPEGDIKIKSSDCSGTLFFYYNEPLDQNPSFSASLLHIKGKGMDSTSLVLGSDFQIEQKPTKRLVIEGLIIKCENGTSLKESLIYTYEEEGIWLKDVKFQDFRSETMAVYPIKNSTFKNVFLENVDCSSTFFYLPGSVNISGLTIKTTKIEGALFLVLESFFEISNSKVLESRFRSLVRFEYLKSTSIGIRSFEGDLTTSDAGFIEFINAGEISIEELILIDVSFGGVLLSFKDSQSLTLDTLNIDVNTQKQDCSSLIQVSNIQTQTQLKSVSVNGSPCQKESNLASPVFDIQKSRSTNFKPTEPNVLTK